MEPITGMCPVASIVLDAGILGKNDCKAEYEARISTVSTVADVGYGGIRKDNTTGMTQLYEWTADTGAGYQRPGDFHNHGPGGYVVDFLATSTHDEVKRQVRGLMCDPKKPVDMAEDGTALWSEELSDRTGKKERKKERKKMGSSSSWLLLFFVFLFFLLRQQTFDTIWKCLRRLFATLSLSFSFFFSVSFSFFLSPFLPNTQSAYPLLTRGRSLSSFSFKSTIHPTTFSLVSRPRPSFHCPVTL